MHGGDILLKRIIEGNTAQVQSLIEADPSIVNTQCKLGSKLSALQVAILEGQWAIVRLLVSHSVKMSYVDLVSPIYMLRGRRISTECTLLFHLLALHCLAIPTADTFIHIFIKFLACEKCLKNAETCTNRKKILPWIWRFG